MIKYLLLFLLIPSIAFAAIDCSGDGGDMLKHNVISSDMVNGQDWTISYWISTTYSPSSDWQTPIVTILDGSDGWGLGIDNEGEPFSWTIGNNSSDINCTPINDGVWRNITSVFDQLGNEMRHYINGSLDCTETSYNDNSGTTNAPIRICEDGSEAVGGELKISDVAIWSVELTPAEIAHIGASRVKGMPLQIQADNLVAYFPLDDIPSGTSVNSQTFRDLANDNTLTGTDGDGDTTSIGEEILSYP